MPIDVAKLTALRNDRTAKRAATDAAIRAHKVTSATYLQAQAADRAAAKALDDYLMSDGATPAAPAPPAAPKPAAPASAATPEVPFKPV
jgi:hypothetical protein